MQQPARAESSATFAGMLAAFATPGQKKPPARDLDGLEDDVATLSYERALRAHGRYRSPEASDQALTQPYKSERLSAEEPPVLGDVPVAALRTSQASEFAHTDSAYERNLKSASITIRLSKAECAQLRQRAAEAGLTISAYLRSCTVEAESLRAQVKETLAQLRAESAREDAPAGVSASASWFGWLRMFWPFAFGDKGKRAVLRARLG